MPRHLTTATVSVQLLLLAVGPTSGAADGASGIEFFEKRVRPLLAEHCYECHSADAEELKAGLYLDSRTGWQIGGDSGPTIVPGKPDDSLIIHAVTHTNGDLKMPPKTRLSDAEVETLRQWIAMGAPDPREGGIKKERKEIDLEEGRRFWSFQPAIRHPVPQVTAATWPNNDIDRFILSRLEREHIKPAKDATRRTLLRRIHYDLTGLPPSPEEIDAFLGDVSPRAFETVVDGLLARPEFGERWGRHWLDVARFAESSGGGRSLVFPHAWRFRDYVIDSLNKDKPYDVFVREQLAGDALDYDSSEQRNDQLTGSAYLVLGAINYELQDQEQLEMEFVDEQIDAVGRTFLGMTLGCARCHDHKFDPIPATDYYALAGIFQSTESMGSGSAANGVSSFATTRLELPDKPEVQQLRASLASFTEKISTLRKTPTPNNSSGSITPANLPGLVVDTTEARLAGTWKPSTFTGAWVGNGYVHDENQPKGAHQVEFATKLPETKDYEVLVAYSTGKNRSSNTPVTINHADGETTVEIDQTKAPVLHGCLVSVGTFSFSSDQLARVTISNAGTNGVVIADAVSFANPDRVNSNKEVSVDPKKVEAEIKRLEKQRKTITGKLKKLEPITMAPSESATPADGRVHIRGQVRNKGEEVPRGFLSVAMAPGSTADIADHSSGRRELADWITRADHPLTARVMVNRVWMHLLGEGIVRTPDNFGRTGQLPSHPELLDYLALRFVDNNWSLKTLVREIALSRTYQLSSQSTTETDPENRLFGRAHRKQLDAESIRDTALLFAGQLDRTRGGMTIRNPGQYDLNYKFDTVRRSVYVPRFRNSILDIFEVFDAANPNLVVGRRSSTNLPTQALFLMNSDFIRAQSEFTAKRLIADGATIDDAYELMLGRPATDAERESTNTFLSTIDSTDKEEAWTQLCQALFSCLDFRFLY